MPGWIKNIENELSGKVLKYQEGEYESWAIKLKINENVLGREHNTSSAIENAHRMP